MTDWRTIETKRRPYCIPANQEGRPVEEVLTTGNAA